MSTMIPLLLNLTLQATVIGFSPEMLWQTWPEQRFVGTPAPCLRAAELEVQLRALVDRHPGKITMQEVGRSFEERPVHLLTLGDGPRKVLLWSQMHGDEPSATPALLDIADFLLAHAEEPLAAAVLDELTLLMIPMLNPDGAEIYQRRNMQGIDINRDALNLATPEGRILKKVRDEYEPILGFNLHDQNRRTAVGDTGVLATNALLAVSGDEQGTVTPGRLRAQRACTAIVEALAPFVPDGMARYDEDWSPRAFGDNVTAWGTPVVLIESGGLPPGWAFTELTRTNFVAILTVLQKLVQDDLMGYDPQIYADLLRNESDVWADVVVRGGFLHQPGFGPSYRADLAFNVEIDDREAAGCGGEYPRSSEFVEVGDARFLGAGRVVDASESLVVAPFVAGVDGWSARRWMHAGVFAEWARAGVGSLLWSVPGRKLEAARSLVGELAGEDLVRVEVVPSGSAMPWLMLTGPASRRASDSLEEILTSLGGPSIWKELVSGGSLARLWSHPLSPRSRPEMRRGRPATYLLLSPAPEGVLDLENAHLASVWINGRAVSEAAP